MHNRHRATLDAIFAEPTPAQMRWVDIESLFASVGVVREGSGSRVRVRVNDVPATFHRPHPRSTVGRMTIANVRVYLTRAGVTPWQS